MKSRAPYRMTLRPQLGIATDALAELSLSASDVLDLCTGKNPAAPPRAVLEAARDADLLGYPDPTGTTARARVAQRFGIGSDAVVLGSGGAELLWSCARVLLEPNTTVLAIEPSYPEFATAARQLGARVVQWRSVERTGHCVDLAQVAELMALETPQVVSICAPGNPTGASVRFAELAALAAHFPDAQFVVDQSFLALSDDREDMLRLPARNMLCVRSLSKEFGIPGVRAAYALAEPGLCARIEATRPAYSTSSQTQAVIAAAMDQATFSEACAMQVHADRQRLAALLEQLGLTFTPSVAPFLLVRLARASEIARELLARHRIAVCDATPFGLPDHLRISGVSGDDAPQLTAALAELTRQRGLVHGRES